VNIAGFRWLGCFCFVGYCMSSIRPQWRRYRNHRANDTSVCASDKCIAVGKSNQFYCHGHSVFRCLCGRNDFRPFAFSRRTLPERAIKLFLTYLPTGVTLPSRLQSASPRRCALWSGWFRDPALDVRLLFTRARFTLSK